MTINDTRIQYLLAGGKNKSLNATGTVSEEYQIYLDSAEAATERFGVAITESYKNIVNGETVKALTDTGTAVLEFANKWGLLESTLKGFLAIGVMKGIGTLTTAIRGSIVQVTNFGTALNTVKKMSSMTKGTTEYANALNALKSSCIGLTNAQLKQVLSNTTLSNSERIKILQYQGLTKAQAQARLSQLELTQSTNTQSAANASATASTFSLSTAEKGLAANLKLAFMSNPIGMSIMAISTVVGIATSVISKHNQKLEETIQATKQAADSYKESALSIDDYVSRYQELHKALIAAKGNEEETYSIKQQLLELQTELNSTFGDEYEKINLVTDAYKDATESIKAYNKESSQRFLNENRKGIEEAIKQMEGVSDYYLGSMSGLVNSSELEYLDKIKEIASDHGIGFDNGSFQFTGTATEASSAINSFMNDVRDLQKEAGSTSDMMSDIFDGILDNSAVSLSKAEATIEEFHEIYEQAQIAQIASNANLSKGYNEAISAVEAYNQALLKSENPFGDEDVQKAWDNLQTVRQGIQENEDEWGQYSNVMDDVFSAANDSVYSFYQALQSDDSISNLAEELRGLSDIELRAMYDDGNNGDAFDKLAESCNSYGVSVDELIDLLQKLGIVQSKILEEATEEIPSFSDRFQNLWDSDAFKDAKEDLTKLSQEAGITASDIQSLARENEELASLLTESGMSAQFAATCFNEVCDGVDGFATITEDALALDQVLHGMDESLQKVAASKSTYDSAMKQDDYNAEFKDYQDAYKNAMEMFENGDYGRHFRSAMEYLLGDDSYTMSIEEMYESMKNLKSVFGEDATNGLEFLDKLYGKKDILDGMQSSLEKLSDGSYDFDLKPEEFEAIGNALGMTADEVAACTNALGMFGDFHSYDLGELEETLNGISIAAKNGEQSVLSLQGVQSILSDLGYNGYEAYSILQDIGEMGSIELLDFGVVDSESIQSIIDKLKELDMIEIDGSNINVSGLIDTLMNTFGMASDDISNFLTNLNKDFQFSDAEGNLVSLSQAKDLVLEAKDTSAIESVDKLGESAVTTDDKVNILRGDIDSLNSLSMSELTAQFSGVGSQVDNVSTKLDGLSSKIDALNSKALITLPINIGGTTGSQNTNTPSSVSGSGKALGNAQIGHSFADGTIGAPKTEMALINELGNETIIDPKSGTYEIVDGGAQFRKIKKGQIILNHLQTQALQKYGKISSFGKMLFSGNAKIKGSSFKVGSDGYNAAVKYNEALKANTQATYDLKSAQEDYKSWLSEAAVQKFENIQTDYEHKLHKFEQKAEHLNNLISLNEEKGYLASAVYYKKLISNEQKNNAKMEKERDALVKSLDKSVSNGDIKKYSDEWYDLKEKIDSVTNALEESIISIQSFMNALRQVKWDRFDYIQSNVSDLISDVNFAINELSRNDLVSDKVGGLTDDGKSVAALRASNYETYKEQAYNSLLNKIRELISEYEDLLDAEKDAYDYQQSIAEKTKDIADIRKQLSVYYGDMSEEARAKIQRLEVDLAEAEKSLQEAQYNKYISDTKDMFDDLEDTLADEINDLIIALADNFDRLIESINGYSQDALKNVKDYLNTIGFNTKSSISNVGALIAEAVNSGTDVTKATQATISDIKDILQRMQQYADSAANGKDGGSSSSASSGAEGEQMRQQYADKITNLQTRIDELREQQAYAKNQYDQDIDKILAKAQKATDKNKKNEYKEDANHLKETRDDIVAQYEAEIESLLHEMAGLSELMKQLENADIQWQTYRPSAKYAKGSKSIPYDQLALTQEEGSEFIRTKDGALLTPLNRGDMVFTNDISENLWKLLQVNPQDIFKGTMPSMNDPEINRNMESNVNIGIGDIVMNGVNDPETFGRQLRDEICRNGKTMKCIAEAVSSKQLGRGIGNATLYR